MPGSATRILVRPVGRIPRGVVRGLGRALARTYGLPVAIAGGRHPGGAYRVRRRQHRADKLLESFDRSRRVGDLVLAVTAADVYVPGFNFLFGLSYLSGDAALVSTARLADGADDHALASRAVKLAVHEVGHALGLGHCRSLRCVMRYSDHVGALDRESDRLCRSCRAKWARISVRLDRPT